MKKYLLFISILVSICSFAQTPSGSKTRYTGVLFSSKDTATNATTADSIAILVNRADSSLRWRYSVTAPWKKVLTSSDNDFIRNQTGSNLSAQTAKFYVTDTMRTSTVSRARKMYADTLLATTTTRTPQLILQNSGFGAIIQAPVTADALVNFPDKSGTVAFLSDTSAYQFATKTDLKSYSPISGTFTNRRIPFSNSSGQLKDTTGFTWAAETLSVPGVIEANGDIYTIGTGKGYYGQYLDIEDNVTNSIAIIYNSNANGGGATIQGGNNLNKPTLKLFGYSGDSIANFNPLGIYLYNVLNGDSAYFTKIVNIGTVSGTGAVVVRKTTGAQAAFYGSSDIANNRDGSGKILLGSNGSYQGVLQYYDGGSTILYLDNSFDNASAQIKLRLRTNGTPVDALILDGTGNATFPGIGTGTVYSNAGTLTNTNPSDSSLKDSIKTLTYGLNEILQLKPKTFYYKSDSTHSSLKYGFIAQDVQPIMPDVVRKINPKDSTSKLGLETDGIYVALVNAIKEQQAQIETLKAELADIKAILQRNNIK